MPKAVGTATITVTGAGGTNYNSISKTYAATVQQAYQWTLTDKDSSGTISVGDMVTPKISSVATERFYIMGIDGTGDTQTVRLLAVFPINTASLTQSCNNSQPYSANCSYNSTNAPSMVTFSTSGTLPRDASKYSGSTTLKNWIDQYTTKLVNAGLILEDIEITEGGSPVSGVKGRPFWASDNNRYNSTSEWTTFIKGRSIHVNAWSGSGYANDNYSVSYCNTNSCWTSSTPQYDTHPIQPVIRVKTSKIQK